MICPQCNSSNDDSAMFCNQCGTRFLAPATAEPYVRAYGSFWQRLAAYLIDGFIAGMIALIPALVLGFLAYEAELPDGSFVSAQERQDAEDLGYGIGYLVVFAVAILYFWIGNSVGGTWGKRIMGLRVVSEDGDGNIGLGRGALRLFIYYLGAAAFYIGWLWMIWDNKKQGWHDMVARSLVVRA